MTVLLKSQSKLVSAFSMMLLSMSSWRESQDIRLLGIYQCCPLCTLVHLWNILFLANLIVNYPHYALVLINKAALRSAGSTAGNFSHTHQLLSFVCCFTSQQHLTSHQNGYRLVTVCTHFFGGKYVYSSEYVFCQCRCTGPPAIFQFRITIDFNVGHYHLELESSI